MVHQKVEIESKLQTVTCLAIENLVERGEAMHVSKVHMLLFSVPTPPRAREASNSKEIKLQCSLDDKGNSNAII